MYSRSRALYVQLSHRSVTYTDASGAALSHTS